MKKLMLAAAVATAAFGLKAEIASANVVGYLDYNLSRGFNFFTPVFERIDGENLALSDITLSDAGDGQSYIQIVTTSGSLGAVYAWFAADTAGTEKDCWFDEESWSPVDFDLTDGQAFYVYAATETAKAKVNGQVRDDVYSVPLSRGFNCVGNSTPKNLDVQAMALTNAGDGQSYIQVVTSTGSLGPVYAWFAADTAGTDKDCWFDEDAWAPIEGVEYAAGEGFYLYIATDDATLELPSAL